MVRDFNLYLKTLQLVHIQAMGYQTTASGNFQQQWETIASGGRSTAMGQQTEAIGDYSTAIGYQTTASGDRSTALGYKTAATADRSFAFGVFQLLLVNCYGGFYRS